MNFIDMLNKLNIANWRDSFEILFFALIIYYFISWLKKDTQKNLVYAFYFYCIILFGSYYIYLPTISYLLFNFAPIVFIIFIILHHDILQKNFVMLKYMQKSKLKDHDSWFEELTRASLSALHNNKELICVIEQNDSLQSLIKASCLFYADLKKDIFDILLEKHHCDINNMIMLNQSGKIVTINAQWNFPSQQLVTPGIPIIAKWKQDGIIITTKTDALIFKTNSLTRTFDLIIQGKILEEISGEQTFSILQRNLKSNSIYNKNARDKIMETENKL